MNKCVFTLGLILTSIYTTAAMAWPTKTATGVWTNSGHTTLATMRCDDCCKTNCWLPNGTYYDDTGTFTESCIGEPSEPTCISGKTYSVVNGVCGISCPTGQYDIGLTSGTCVDPSVNATSGSGNTSAMTWTATFTNYGTISGRATCVTSGASKQGFVDNTNDLTRTTYTTNGANCWCQMTSPRKSGWVFMSGNTGGQGTSTQVTSCKNGCANNCASAIRYVTVMREGFYSSIAGSNQ